MTRVSKHSQPFYAHLCRSRAYCSWVALVRLCCVCVFYFLLWFACFHISVTHAYQAEKAVVTSTKIKLKIYYFTRAPDIYEDPQSRRLKGDVYEPAQKILAKLPIEVTWIPATIKKQIQVLEENAEPLCSFNLYKTKERERFSIASDPLITLKKNRGFVVTRSNFQVDHPDDYLSYFKKEGVRILFKDGASLGNETDRILKETTPKMVSYNSDIDTSIKMIIFNRADVVIVTEDEIQKFIQTHPEDKNKIKFVYPSNTPPEEDRYLLCSKKTDIQFIKDFNLAMAAIKKGNTPIPNKRHHSPPISH